MVQMWKSQRTTHSSGSMVCQLQMWWDSLQLWKLHRKTGLPNPLKEWFNHGSNIVEHCFSDPSLSFKHQDTNLSQWHRLIHCVELDKDSSKKTKVFLTK